ncbi:PREDICTED: Werner Syndrome-like exonuclease isoform X2 [Dinoponera quadriceps]|uniref:3'-5' exonuclease n=1 Tax=Dinoponera quadriceps TaxID=609295 RepID=A0A6P3WPZ4_DINQU|nr:PREDICTED: Werner Syndrome-like exonuclease isoform X2 [Dinoponera quadriceps]
MAVTTRSAQLGKEVSGALRRSPRNLPQHLKEKLEQPKPEREPDIETLPPIIFKGHIQYANDFFDCAQICDSLIQEVKRSEKEFIPVGFDLEWPFSFQTGSGKTALAQICLQDSVCYLLHVYSLKKLPAAFVEFLCHPKVKLVGVNIKNDVWKLGRDFKEFPAQKVVQNNCMDCGTYANQVLKRSCRWSLERLTAYLLKKKIDKNPEVRRSKWHVQPLSDAQKIYAATDAYVSLLLHTTIQAKAVALEKQSQNHENSVKPLP